MTAITAHFQIVTPMFLGGAGHEAESIRPPSVKGALRFWWRALNWGRFRRNAADDIAALQTLHREEARLFGTAAKERKGGQGVFLLAVRHAVVDTGKDFTKSFTGTAYLKGMGLNDRNAIKPGGRFEVVLRFRPGLDAADRSQIEDALRPFGIAGGLGARSRRGFGSVVRLMADGRNGHRLPTETELNGEIVWLKKQIPKNSGPIRSAPPFSAFADGFALGYTGPVRAENSDVLEDIGAKFNRFRTNGTAAIYKRDKTTKQMVIDRAAKPGCRIVGSADIPITNLRFFATDHHSVHAIARARSIPTGTTGPERSIFGLPHPYRFSSLKGTNVVFDYAPNPSNPSRRASPLFIHVCAFRDGNENERYMPLILLLESRFLPRGAQLRVKVGSLSVGSVPVPVSFQPVKDFLSSGTTGLMSW